VAEAGHSALELMRGRLFEDPVTEGAHLKGNDKSAVGTNVAKPGLVGGLSWGREGS
jgi:hypothetical protein